ncbi:Na+/H+ antiporter NhaC family protein [Hyphomonas sp.]|uniref:Na+/H+ antiporter NhaC family protein n=1 Tax=Hyphomonas sp. TaxID=87 RepID=UPI00391AE25C
MDWLSVLPPLAAIAIAIWTRNVYWALGFAILLAETLAAGFNPALGALASVDRAAGVFTDAGNTRILLFCLIIGALIAYLERAGGFRAMVRWLTTSGTAAGPKRASGVTAASGVVLFIETNVSLLATGLLGKPLFDRLGLSRARLAYIIDSTCAPVSVLILLNGWGAFILGLLAANGVEAPLGVMLGSISLNFYALLTLALVAATILTGRTFGPMRAFDDAARAAPAPREDEAATETGGSLAAFLVPMFILVGGAIGFMWWTGDGNILRGSGSRAILWSVILATAAAFLFAARVPALRGKLVETGFDGMGKLLPAVTVIFLALALGDSLRALGTGVFLSGLASNLPMPWLLPAVLFLTACLTSFTTGTSWGTYGILVPVAIPLAVGAGIPLPLALAAVMGGGVFGDHCSPISDTTIIASLASGCDHLDHVRTQLPYALLAGAAATVLYAAAGLLA